MPSILPILRGVSAALYPFVQTFTAQTGIADGENGSATRWVKGPPLVRFELQSPRLRQADKNTLKAFFTSAKGQLSTDLKLTTYQDWTNLSFDDNEFASVENASTRYDVAWRLTQTLPQNFSPGAPVAAYPSLIAGSISKLPYTQRKRFNTISSKMPSGPKYSLAEFGGTFTNFPSGGLMSWDLDQVNLLDSEVNTLLAHWLTNYGNAMPFTFTDEDGVTYPKVYYGSPELSIRWNRKNSAEIRTTLVQTF
jgi:hypothetical protein